MPPSILVIGCGSIGRRHARNLRSLGVKDLRLVDSQMDLSQSLARELGAKAEPDLATALTGRPQAALVCTPSHLHLEPLWAALDAGCHLFVEKPLAVELDGVDALVVAAEAAGVTTLVGCNMRFHWGPELAKRLLDDGLLGRPLFARLQVGSYLPDWRPDRDYRATYSARADQGGGAILDCIHELDLARWLLGPARAVTAMMGHLSSLEIDAEDVAEVLIRHQAGTISEVHLDLVQRSYERGCQVVGENGSLWWDYRGEVVRLLADAGRRSETFAAPPGWESNRMYLKEMEHFLACLAGRATSTQTLGQGAQALRLALAAKRADQLGRALEPEAIA